MYVTKLLREGSNTYAYQGHRLGFGQGPALADGENGPWSEWMVQRSRRFLFRTRHVYLGQHSLEFRLVAKQHMKERAFPFGIQQRAAIASSEQGTQVANSQRDIVDGIVQDRTRSISGRAPLRLLIQAAIQSSMEGKANDRSLVSYYYEAKASSMTVHSPAVQPGHHGQARLPGAVAKAKERKKDLDFGSNLKLLLCQKNCQQCFTQR